ncbi:type III-B CRISPR module RAMP protein Cmr1 [Kosmotoga sp. DU53]|uniref:type III-B CRISPR module RAMP protein Cmr1 n=1 Tax=Kosmotoga sp. DU53 TaxID=1310160 RepID=UPI0007C5CB0D|nr:type III-B CRISPR module RAMP protein Cmr1 [Kosmotoga sp. DU53]
MRNEPITFKIKTLTPLWTGGADEKMDRIHETGIIGSIRWWYEAIVRGLGYYVCDPTDLNIRCPGEVNKKQRKEYCLACLLFGSTGFKRRFRVSLYHPEFESDKSASFKVLSGREHKGKKGGWFINSGYSNDYILSVTPLDEDFNSILIQLPLKLAANCGALGAKPQLGYGVFNFEEKTELSTARFIESISKISSDEKLKKSDIRLRNKTIDSFNYPNIKEMFFAKIRFRTTEKGWWKGINGLKQFSSLALKNWIDNCSAPISPTIKNWLRYNNGSAFWKLQKCKTGELAKWLFGVISKDGNIASKINISGAYKPIKDEKDLWEFRIWGWVPPQYEKCSNFNREEVLNGLKELLLNAEVKDWQNLFGKSTRSFKLNSWREFNSDRDTKSRLSNINDYINSLVRDGSKGVKK